MTEPRIPASVAQQLGYYVYLYIDPRTRRPFYVGKGKGRRVLAHLNGPANALKAKILRELSAKRLRPRLEVLAHGLPDAETALRIEAAAIDLLGLDSLTNQVGGWRSLELGRVSLPDLIAHYAPRPVKVVHRALLIRINRLYRHRMSATELYEATRGVWRIGARRVNARYAMPVFHGIVREVYRVVRWYPAGTLRYLTRVHDRLDVKDRWEFSGRVAANSVRDRYLDRWVGDYLRKGGQNPIAYVNC